MVAILAVHYNFARIHTTLRVTPAMAAGLSDHVWDLEHAEASKAWTIQEVCMKMLGKMNRLA